MITTEHLHIGDIVALPTGFIAQVKVLTGTSQIGLQYPGRAVTFYEEVTNLRYLGPEYQPLHATKSLDDLIRTRNEKALQLRLGNPVGKKMKSAEGKAKIVKTSANKERKALLDAIASASSPEEVRALLKQKGLLS